MYVCKICNLELKSTKAYVTHILKDHNISLEDYYRQYIATGTEGVCKICGKPTRFISINKGFKRYCSSNCARQDPSLMEELKRRNMEKYGVEWPLQSEAIKAKQRATCLERYGVECVTLVPEIRERQLNTVKEKYGCDNVFQNEEIKERSRQTCLEKYGVENIAMLEETQAKMQATCLERYGVKHPLHSEAIKQQIRETCLERYGVDSVAKDVNIKKKQRATKEERYGISSFDDIVLTNTDACAVINNIKINYADRVRKVLTERNISFTELNGCVIIQHACKEIRIQIDHVNFNTDSSVLHIYEWEDVNKKLNYFLKEEIEFDEGSCVICEIEASIAKSFLDTHSWLSPLKEKYMLYNIGLYYKGQLSCVMSIGKPRYNKKYEYEILRSHCLINSCEAAMFNHFREIYHPSSVIVYRELLDNIEIPGFRMLRKDIRRHWFNPSTGKHITDALLKTHGFDRLFGRIYGAYGAGVSSDSLMRSHGFVEIYDCGQASYIWKY